MKKLNITFLFAIAFFTTGITTQAQEKISIVVAANLKSAMDSILIIYHQQNLGEITQVNYGSSGKLYEQIQNGAPFDMFFAANLNYPNKLKASSFGISKVKTYAVGKLAIWSKKLDPNTAQMNSLLDTSIKKDCCCKSCYCSLWDESSRELKTF
jgi:molybdate transport system substrate-binding protein